MMLEQHLESKLIDDIRDALADLGDVKVELIGSRLPSAETIVKGEHDASAAVTIIVAMGLRAHDAFSVPTVNVSGTVDISTRIELSANGASHEAVVEKIVGLFSSYQCDVEDFSEYFSASDFYATELRLDGGAGKNFDSGKAAWSEAINFTFRGALK